MNKFKKFLCCMCIGVMGLGVAGCSNTTDKPEVVAQSPDTVLATVGEKEIKEVDMERDLAYVEQMLVMQFGEDYKNNEEAMAYYAYERENLLNYLVEVEVVLQKAKELGVEVSEEEIDAEIEQIKAGYESEEAFNEALDAAGLTIDSYKEEIRKSYQIAGVMEDITKDIAITDADVEAHYNSNVEKYTVGPGAQMYHIVVETEEEAKEIKDKLDAGEAFGDLAMEYGLDGTKYTGGSLGFVAYDEQNIDPDFLAGAKALGEGEISAPVKSSFGWHIIKVDGISNDTTVTALDEVKEEIHAELEDDARYEAFMNALTAWKEEIGVKIL